MKRIITALFAALLLLPLCALRFSTGEAEETIVRVRLSTDDASTVSVTLSGQYAVDDKTVTGGTVTASIKNGTITLKHSSAGTLKSSSTSVRLARIGTDDGTTITFQNAKHGKRVYFGDFVFYNDGGTMRVLNYVDMHRYLYGVVSGELSDSSKPDFLKVETIIAKGFALAEVESRKTKYFDVYDTTQSQLYYGYVKEDANTIAAVDAVWRQTLRFEGKTVKTYYSTADGGQIITPRIRWGGTANDGAYWFGYDPFDLAGSSKNVSFAIRGDAPKSMDAALYAFLLNRADAKEIVSVDALTGLYDPDNPNGTARYPSTLAPQKRYDWTLTVRDDADRRKQVSFSCTPDEVKAAIAPSAAGAICFAVRTAEKEWKLVWGVNSGHRAGLSHRGAKQMVKEGYSYVDVLKFYYRGATLFDENGRPIESNATFPFTYEEGASPQPTAQPTPTPTPVPPEELPPVDHLAIVTAIALNMRAGPSVDSDPVAVLQLGTILSVFSEENGWLYVYDEHTCALGYVSAAYASYYEREPTAKWEGVCNADDSNLRSGPSTNFTKYYAIDSGNPLYVYYRSGNWYFVMDRNTGRGAFIWKDYVTLGAEAPKVLIGDANVDGTVDATDASLILRYLVGLSPMRDAQLLAADGTRNGAVEAADASLLLRRLVGLEP